MGQYFNEKVESKKRKFAEFALDLFKNKYQSIVTDNSVELYDEYEKECIDKAKELFMDIDMLEYNGECIFLKDAGLEYSTSKKTIWWEYNEDQFLYHSWI